MKRKNSQLWSPITRPQKAMRAGLSIATVIAWSVMTWIVTALGLGLMSWSVVANASVNLKTTQVFMVIAIIGGVITLFVGLYIFEDVDMFWIGLAIAVVAAIILQFIDNFFGVYSLTAVQVMVTAAILPALITIVGCTIVLLTASANDGVEAGEVTEALWWIPVLLFLLFVIFSFIPGLAVWIASL